MSDKLSFNWNPKYLEAKYEQVVLDKNGIPLKSIPFPVRGNEIDKKGNIVSISPFIKVPISK